MYACRDGEKKHFVVFNDKECTPAVGHAKAAMNLLTWVPAVLVSPSSSAYVWLATKIHSLFNGDTDFFFQMKHNKKSIELWINS